MMTTLEKISALTARLSDSERDLVEQELVKMTEALVAVCDENAAHRDTLTRQSLAEIEVGNFIGFEEFEKRLSAFRREMQAKFAEA